MADDRSVLPAADPGPETVEEELAVAAVVFGDALPDARRYVRLLAGPGIVRGLIGPREAGRLWSRHLLNCAVAAEVLPRGARVVDIGSGAGLPGIAMALARPDLRVDLVEPLLRRTVFLDEAVTELGLGDRCRVIRGRAEDVAALAGGADAVTARAMAPLAKLAGWAAPLLRDGGLFAALKGTTAAAEMHRDREACRAAGIVDLTVREIGGPGLADPTTVVLGRRETGAERAPATAPARAASHGGRASGRRSRSR